MACLTATSFNELGIYLFSPLRWDVTQSEQWSKFTLLPKNRVRIHYFPVSFSWFSVVRQTPELVLLCPNTEVLTITCQIHSQSQRANCLTSTRFVGLGIYTFIGYGFDSLLSKPLCSGREGLVRFLSRDGKSADKNRQVMYPNPILGEQGKFWPLVRLGNISSQWGKWVNPTFIKSCQAGHFLDHDCQALSVWSKSVSTCTYGQNLPCSSKAGSCTLLACFSQPSLRR